jgi:fatty-acyl-CoA synthase
VPDAQVGDQVMAAVVLNDGAQLSPAAFGAFLAEQQDLSPKAWPRYVRINGVLPQTATNKILKRELISAGVSAGAGTLWARPARSHSYAVVTGDVSDLRCSPPASV